MEWERVQRALVVEIEKGYCDVIGRNSSFSQFMAASLAQKPDELLKEAIMLWHEIATQISDYASLSLFQRQQLLQHTKLFLQQARIDIEELSREECCSTEREQESYFDEEDFIKSEECVLKSIEHDSRLTLSQRMDLINGRKIEHCGRKFKFFEYLEFEADQDKFETLRERNYVSSLNWIYLKRLLEFEEKYEFRNLVTKVTCSVRLSFPYFGSTPFSLDGEASNCTYEIRLGKFICLSIGNIPDSYPREMDYRIRRIALKFARYSNLELSKRKLLVEEAASLFPTVQAYVALLPENRPQWVDDYNPYAYFDLAPGSLPCDKFVDHRYMREMRKYSSEVTTIDVVAGTNYLLRAFFEDYERLPKDESEFDKWLRTSFFCLEEPDE